MSFPDTTISVVVVASVSVDPERVGAVLQEAFNIAHRRPLVGNVQQLDDGRAYVTARFNLANREQAEALAKTLRSRGLTCTIGPHGG